MYVLVLPLKFLAFPILPATDVVLYSVPVLPVPDLSNTVVHPVSSCKSQYPTKSASVEIIDLTSSSNLQLPLRPVDK